MKKIYKTLAIILAVFFCFSPIYPIAARDNEVLVDGQYIHIEKQEVIDSDNSVIVALNRDGKVVEELSVEGNYVYRIVNEKKVLILYFEWQEPISTFAIEPTWGPLISQTVKVTFPNPESSSLTALVAFIASGVFPYLAVPISAAQLIGEYIFAYRPNYVNTTVYFNEALGCPKYRWYRRQVYRSSSGAIIHDYTLNQKTFIGVRNSPENPPACREYGF